MYLKFFYNKHLFIFLKMDLRILKKWKGIDNSERDLFGFNSISIHIRSILKLLKYN